MRSEAVCYQREEPSMEHVLRKPVDSRHAYETTAADAGVWHGAGAFAGIGAGLCSDGMRQCNVYERGQRNRPPVAPALNALDVQNIVQAAAMAADTNTMVIAVVDRGGGVLAVYRKLGAGASDIGNFGAAVNVNDLAVALARTAAYFSNDQAPLSSRTVRFISGIHFPPGVTDAAPAALYGIENTNRGCTLATNYLPGQSVAPSLALGGGTGLGIITGKADLLDSNANAVDPGGVPIFRGGVVVGGVGVAGATSDVAEYAAYAAATSNGFGPTPAAPGVVFINGIALPFVNQTTAPRP